MFDQGTVDVDLHLLTLTDAGTCVKRADRELEGPLQPGTYYIVVDTLGTATPGEFGLVVLPEARARSRSGRLRGRPRALVQDRGRLTQRAGAKVRCAGARPARSGEQKPPGPGPRAPG